MLASCPSPREQLQAMTQLRPRTIVSIAAAHQWTGRSSSGPQVRLSFSPTKLPQCPSLTRKRPLILHLFLSCTNGSFFLIRVMGKLKKDEKAVASVSSSAEPGLKRRPARTPKFAVKPAKTGGGAPHTPIPSSVPPRRAAESRDKPGECRRACRAADSPPPQPSLPPPISISVPGEWRPAAAPSRRAPSRLPRRSFPRSSGA